MLFSFLLAVVVGLMLFAGSTNSSGGPRPVLAEERRPRAALTAVDLSLFGFVGGWLVAVGLAQLGGAVYPTGGAEGTTVLELLTGVHAPPATARASHSRAN